jgi:hypothetical protein
VANMTPPLHALGRYVTKTPWELPNTVIYECIAIRTFEDCAKQGLDVYERFYKNMGLENSPTFNFSDEQTAKANIITLKGSDQTVIYIPDTFILSYPQAGNITYHHVVMSASIGAIPEYLNLTGIMREVEDLISAKIGTTVTVKQMVCPTSDQPTQQQHEILEAARVGSVSSYENNYTRLQKEQQKSALLDAKVKTLITILQANNLMPKP